MLEEWLIDGYNLLHGVRSKKKSGTLSREILFELLAGFASQDNRKVLMILDGYGNDDELEPYRTKSFAIQYSKTMTADSVIEKMLYDKKGSGSFIVVTKDRAVTQIARGLGSRVIEPAEFMKLMKASVQESDSILFKEKVKSHGFNRPFDKKLNFPLE